MPTPSRKPIKPVALTPAADLSIAAPEASVAAVQESAREVVDAAESSVVEFQEMFRQSAERGLEQTKAAYERMKAAAEDATGALEATYQRGTKGLSEISAKAIDVLKTNADAQFDFVKALLAVKEPSEAFALQSAFARQQFEAVKEQFAELTETAQRIAKETAEPLKSSFGKTFSVAA